MEIFNNATVAALISSILAFLGAYYIYKRTHNNNLAIVEGNRKREAFSDIKDLHNHLLNLKTKMENLVFDNCFSITHESISGIYLMKEATIYYPPKETFAPKTLQQHDGIPIGFYKMLSEFNSDIDNINKMNKKNRASYSSSFSEIKFLIFQLVKLIRFSNEIIAHCEWFELQSSDKSKIEDIINSGVGIYGQEYEGLYHVPWIKDLFEGDDKKIYMFEHFNEARKNSGDTGIYM